MFSRIAMYDMYLLLHVTSQCSIKVPVGVSPTGCRSNNVYQWVAQLAFHSTTIGLQSNLIRKELTWVQVFILIQLKPHPIPPV